MKDCDDDLAELIKGAQLLLNNKISPNDLECAMVFELAFPEHYLLTRCRYTQTCCGHSRGDSLELEMGARERNALA